MAAERFTVLVVDDQLMNRQILRGILQSEYDVVEACNGREALERLYECRQVAAVLLDLVMPEMDGYAFLHALQDTPYAATPVLVTTADNCSESEQKALDCGAWDFVPKPYRPGILLLRLKNVIVRSRYHLLSRMKHAYEHDPLTGLNNRASFFAQARRLLDDSPGQRFVLVHLDLRRFHVFNSYWGEKEGDRLLVYIAQVLRRTVQGVERCVCARQNADEFCVCEPYDTRVLYRQLDSFCSELKGFRQAYALEPVFGIYVAEHPEEPVDAMYERAVVAAKECKEKRARYCYYRPEMNDRLLREQQITNDMHKALEQHEFVVYLQPKYDLKTETPYGAEALVRWNHPRRGLLAAGDFLPVLERNGFVGQLDRCIWEQVCIIQRRWRDEGRRAVPISVNLSRVSMYNPNLAEVLSGLVERYGLSPRCLNLELTESAYMENPSLMEKQIGVLRSRGFSILMDNFGSGYSSLNTLKNISVDVLKIDMRFLSEQRETGRSECILAAVIRMAGQLNIPVIMEGVENSRQVAFLRSVGCGYVQGFYYSHPLPVQDFEALTQGAQPAGAPLMPGLLERGDEQAWPLDEQIDLLFNSIGAPAAICTSSRSGFRFVRVNAAFCGWMRCGAAPRLEELDRSYRSSVPQKSMAAVEEAFRSAVRDKRCTSCEFLHRDAAGTLTPVRLDLQYWGENDGTEILFAVFLPAGAGA